LRDAKGCEGVAQHRLESEFRAWLEAETDLGIRVVAPFPVKFSEEESVLYEAHVLDFGGPMGMVVGILDLAATSRAIP
jgi:hypothetical protein